MAAITKGILAIISLILREITIGLTEGPIKVIGKMARCMVLEYSHGRMEIDMKAGIKIAKNKVKENSSGRMEEFMTESGETG